MEKRIDRVVGKRPAPRCLVLFSCPECYLSETLDAFDGPPSCVGSVSNDTNHIVTFMRPVKISPEVDPDDVISDKIFGPLEVICSIHNCNPGECFTKHYPWSE